MRSAIPALSLIGMLVAAPAAFAQDTYDSPSGAVRIVGGSGEQKSVTVGDQVIPLGDYYAGLHEKVGNLVLVSISSGGTACPSQFAWLDTTPGKVRISETFGTCSDYAEVSHDNETVTVTMPSLNGSIGNVAFDYDGSRISERQLGLESSETAQAAIGNPDAWIGESPYEYLTAAEHEADLIATIGWDALDELRKTLVIGSQEMTLDGDWIVGSGCQPHMCSSDFSAIAIDRESGEFLAAVKRDGERPRLLGSPAGPLPVEIRKVMTTN